MNNPSTASQFGDDVVFEIRTRTLASPVNVSAWGAAEYESLVDNTRKYRVVSVQTDVSYQYKGDDHDKGIRVVQLEEVDED